eukprot:6193808-Pleurochrysis_carterae.AAC.1
MARRDTARAAADASAADSGYFQREENLDRSSARQARLADICTVDVASYCGLRTDRNEKTMLTTSAYA